MTRKHLCAIVGVFVSVACLVLVTVAMLPPRHGVTKANFDCIHERMTREEVGRIFGRDGERYFPNLDDKIYWEADDGSLAYISFTDGCVVDKIWDNYHEPLLDKFCRWLHLR